MTTFDDVRFDMNEPWPVLKAERPRAEADVLRERLDRSDLTTEQAVDNAVAVYKAAKQYSEQVAEPYRAVMDEAKAMLTDIIVETGQMTWKSAAGQAFVPAAGMTVSYDAKALDALCASSPELKAILWPHRFEKERAGSLTIR